MTRKEINGEWFSLEATNQWYTIWNNDKRKVVLFHEKRENGNDQSERIQKEDRDGSQGFS